jgi:hypothetical protein
MPRDAVDSRVNSWGNMSVGYLATDAEEGNQTSPETGTKSFRAAVLGKPRLLVVSTCLAADEEGSN